MRNDFRTPLARLLLQACLSLSLIGVSTQSINAKPFTVKLGGGEEIVLEIPDHWHGKMESDGERPATARIEFKTRSRKDDRSTWIILSLLDVDTAGGKSASTQSESLPGLSADRETVRSVANRAASQARSQAVESPLSIEESEAGEWFSAYFSATDRAYVGVAEVPKDEFRFMTQGAAGNGRRIVIFTVLSNADMIPTRDSALGIVRALFPSTMDAASGR